MWCHDKKQNSKSKQNFTDNKIRTSIISCTVSEWMNVLELLYKTHINRRRKRVHHLEIVSRFYFECYLRPTSEISIISEKILWCVTVILQWILWKRICNRSEASANIYHDGIILWWFSSIHENGFHRYSGHIMYVKR